MGKNSQRRRADNKNRVSVDPSTLAPSSNELTTEAIDQLIVVASYAALNTEHKNIFANAVRALTNIEVGLAPARPSVLIAIRLQQCVSALFENGWQPADVVHTIKRRCTIRASRLTVAFIAADSRRVDAVHRAPQQWLAQLDDIGAYDPVRGCIVGGHEHPFATWARSEKLDPDEMLSIGLHVLAELQVAPRMSALVAPPSAWTASNRGSLPQPPPAQIPQGEVDAKALKLIRALLAKAEATTFQAEAEAFTAKAQEMMTRHSIDAAVLASAAAGGGRTRGIESRRVHIDSPYADEKADFLAVIADVNGARSVWSPQVAISTIMGFPIDLQLTDLLFTSLLVQATHASAEETSVDRGLRTPSFRRAFLIAFADRVGERLEQTRQRSSAAATEQYGSSLLPILADRTAAVSETFAEAFPNLTKGKSRRLNAQGWHAGRAAADRAHIGAGEAITAG